MKIKDLANPFPNEAVHWRVQGQPYERNGKFSAMALPYIDARDVMDRLDEVCGPENWQDEYVETIKGRIICRIGIRIGDVWVWKSDGAGETAVEGDKGGISDAMKRAAVHWGIGRYLYRLDSPWVQCLVKQKNGKAYWRKWDEDPWTKVKNVGYTQPPKEDLEPAPEETRDRIKAAIAKQTTDQALDAMWGHAATKAAVDKLHPAMQAELQKAYAAKMAKVTTGAFNPPETAKTPDGDDIEDGRPQ